MRFDKRENNIFFKMRRKGCGDLPHWVGAAFCALAAKCLMRGMPRVGVKNYITMCQALKYK